jgi:hypothetical protein
MKHVCKCRVCGCAPSIHKKDDWRGKRLRLYWYECQCGMRAGYGARKSWARFGWNKDNADADHLARIEAKLDRIGRHTFVDWDNGWETKG